MTAGYRTCSVLIGPAGQLQRTDPGVLSTRSGEYLTACLKYLLNKHGFEQKSIIFAIVYIKCVSAKVLFRLELRYPNGL